jgi:hypothetical protein
MSVNNPVGDAPSISAMGLHWPPKIRLLENQIYDFCRANRDLRAERSADRDDELMATSGG